jgi:hypothetical protein
MNTDVLLCILGYAVSISDILAYRLVCKYWDGVYKRGQQHVVRLLLCGGMDDEISMVLDKSVNAVVFFELLRRRIQTLPPTPNHRASPGVPRQIGRICSLRGLRI